MYVCMCVCLYVCVNSESQNLLSVKMFDELKKTDFINHVICKKKTRNDHCRNYNSRINKSAISH